MTYCVDVITADASKLKNRGLAYAFTSSPYIITAFAGPKSSEGFYENVGWRWGFGAFSIILPIVAAPLYFILKFNLRKAKTQGALIEEKNNRPLPQTIWFYIVEFDRKLSTPRKNYMFHEPDWDQLPASFCFPLGWSSSYSPSTLPLLHLTAGQLPTSLP